MIRIGVRTFVLAGAILTLTGCAYDDASGYAPQGYPAGYDSGMGSGLVSQPGDRFGGQNVASVDVFSAELSPYGQWVDSQYGRAFRPDVPQDWRPYVNGQWGENRLWVSNDPWGWATDHYGRWGFDQQIGWVWVPGTEWAPSWVAFREDPEQNVAGWAPVPPGVNYSINLGFGTGFGYDNYASWYGPSWVWVPQSYLYQPGFGGRVLPWNYGANYWGGSRWQYQPGFGGRPRIGYGQGGGYPGRPGYAQPRPPQGGNWQGRPPQSAYGQPRPPQGGGSWQGGGGWQGGGAQGRPGGGYGGQPGGGGRRGISSIIGEGILNNNGVAVTPRPNTERPVMTYADRPRPAVQPQQQQPPRQQYVQQAPPPQAQFQPQPQAQFQPQPRVERQELQRQVQAQSTRRNDEGHTRPD